MAELEYISSAGLRTLFVLGKKLNEMGGSLSFYNLDGMVKEVFNVAGLSAWAMEKGQWKKEQQSGTGIQSWQPPSTADPVVPPVSAVPAKSTTGAEDELKLKTVSDLNLAAEPHGQCLLLIPTGRLDTYGARELQTYWTAQCTEEIVCTLVDMHAVDYISSAALRVLTILQKKLKPRGGRLVLADVKSYCREVLDMAGMSTMFDICADREEGLIHCDRLIREHQQRVHWSDLERDDLACGRVTVVPGSADHGAIHVLGHVNDVLNAAVGVADLSFKRFSQTEFSIGLGGLGDRVEDYFGLMGEMMTIGGIMVWLPTDGHDTPDFLIPRSDTGQVTIRTAYNVSLAGRFNEYLLFESSEFEGTRMDTLYSELFRLAKQRRPDFHGVLGLAMRAQMKAVYGSGVKHSPIKKLAPANGGRIIDPENVKEWMELDQAPRHQNVTALICGVGADPQQDLSYYDRDYFDAVFYHNPGDRERPRVMLHNHGVFFSDLPMNDRPVSLDNEIRTVVDRAEFVDMRHLLDASTITSAFIGVSYVQAFARDPAGKPPVSVS
jgi:anti-anti-sigma factor